jgi:hypothetical protein
MGECSCGYELQIRDAECDAVIIYLNTLSLKSGEATEETHDTFQKISVILGFHS